MKIKEKVLIRDNYVCHYCGDIAHTIDHIIPQSKGGKSNEENLVACCEYCNVYRGAIEYEEFKNFYKKELEYGIHDRQKEHYRKFNKMKGKEKFVGHNKHGIPIYKKI